MNKENLPTIRRKKAKLAGINAILPAVVTKFGLDRRLQEQALFSLWTSLVDPVYCSRSIPIYIDEKGILVIAVENGSIAQELSFLKAKLLVKLQPLALGLGLTIKGMRFDLKSFSQYKKGENIVFPSWSETKNEPTNDQLAAIEFNATEKEELKVLQEKLNQTSSAGLSNRILTLAEKSMRLQKWNRASRGCIYAPIRSPEKT